MRKSILISILWFCSWNLLAQQAMWLDSVRASSPLKNERVLFKAVNTNREPVRYSYALEEDNALLPGQPFVAESRGYTLQTNGAQLVSGVEIPTTVPGALVRISALNPGQPVDQNLAIQPQNLVLVTPANRVLTQNQGIELLVNPEQNGESLFPEGTAVFRIKPEHGAGLFVLFADQLELSNTPYLIQVQEKDSPAIATLQAAKDHISMGQVQEASMKLLGFKALSSSFVAVTAEGQRIDLGPLQSDGTLSWTVPANPGMVEVFGHVEGSFRGLKVIRDIRTVFHVSVPTARFGSTIAMNLEKEIPLVKVGVEVARSGRYEVRGVWFGINAHGQEEAMAVAQSASWLNGNGYVEVEFDPAWAEVRGLKAPFRFGNLELVDQTQMAVLQNQSRGIELRGF